MKSWSLIALFVAASIICVSGCQQAKDVDPAFKKEKAPPAAKKDNTSRQQTVDFGV